MILVKPNFEIKVSKVTNIGLLRLACEFTIDKESKMSLKDIYKCEHSPCRTQMFVIEMYSIPTFVSVHFVRHKIGVEHYVKSNRDDRQSYCGDLGRMQPVNHMMFVNAQSLIQMARKRLCSQAHVETINIMNAIKIEIEKIEPDLSKYMIPECEYRNSYCPELRSCNKNIL